MWESRWPPNYKKSASFIDNSTFVYFDPPYRPIADTASFTAYTKNPFNDKEQIELAKFVDTLHKTGAKIVISNSDPKNFNADDDFFDNIYSAYKIKHVEAARMINCNSDARGKISEDEWKAQRDRWLQQGGQKVIDELNKAYEEDDSVQK